MLRFRRIMYTSSGSGDPGAESLTRTTDAAGFGSTGVAGTPGLAVLMTGTYERAPSESARRYSRRERAYGSLGHAKSGGLGGAPRTPPASQTNQLRDPLAMVCRIAERELGR